MQGRRLLAAGKHTAHVSPARGGDALQRVVFLVALEVPACDGETALDNVHRIGVFMFGIGNGQAHKVPSESAFQQL